MLYDYLPALYEEVIQRDKDLMNKDKNKNSSIKYEISKIMIDRVRVPDSLTIADVFEDEDKFTCIVSVVEEDKKKRMTRKKEKRDDKKGDGDKELKGNKGKHENNKESHGNGNNEHNEDSGDKKNDSEEKGSKGRNIDLLDPRSPIHTFLLMAVVQFISDLLSIPHRESTSMCCLTNFF